MRCVAPHIARRVGGDVIIVGSARSGFFKSGEFPLPCGTCVACLLERSRQWAVRAVQESSLHLENCFVTLTYDDAHLPYASSLYGEDLTRFLKRLRKRYAPRSIRFLSAGEYGSRYGRPHYHLLLFGFDFPDKVLLGERGGSQVFRSPSLESLWSAGRSEIGSVSFESAAYVARYLTDKVDVRELAGRDPEFLRMSLRPAVGLRWIERFWNEVYPRDRVVIRGVEMKPPRFYDKWLEKRYPLLYEEVKFKRLEEIVSPREDKELTDWRLSVNEEVLLAKVNLFSREFAYD